MKSPTRVSRRRLLQMAATLLASGPGAVLGQPRVPIADMHSHYGMITRRMADSGLAEDMRNQRVVLVAWKLVADGPWIRVTNTGIEQASEPAPGELAKRFTLVLDRMKSYIATQQLRTVLTPADVDACVAGDPGIVLASEGADFLEGRVDTLDPAYEKGLRHLQLVHYIRTPVGDFQTTAPTHNGLSPMGRQLVQACNARGVLIDLAHSTGPAVEQALDISKVPIIWSHSWVDADGGHWQDPVGYLQRRLSLALAKKIAGRGGVVGLWGFGLSRPGRGWTVIRGDTKAYARELARLAEQIGPDHVALGTDIEGVGPNWVVNDYSHVRSVIDHLQDMKLDSAVIEQLAYKNYARVLKTALSPSCQNQEPLSIRLFQVVDGGDVGVVQGRQDLRFPPEPGDALGIAGERFRQDLDRHFAIQLGIERAVDLAHAARADLLEDAIVRQGPVDHRHECISGY